MKRYVFLLLIIILIVGCSPAVTPPVEMSLEPVPQVESLREGNWYDRFNEKGDNAFSGMEWLKEEGLDIVALVEKYITTYTSINGPWDILTMNYSVIPCNFSKSDINYNDDALVVIDITMSWWKADCVIYGMYLKGVDGKYNHVYDVKHRAPHYRIFDVTGDLQQELIIEYDDSGNGYSDGCVEIWKLSDSGSFDMIFSEKLDFSANPYNQHKETKDGEKFWAVNVYNDYEFVESEQEGYDIKVKSEIYVHEKDPLLAQGEAIYRYNGEKYVTNNYYDYNATAQEFYDSKE